MPQILEVNLNLSRAQKHVRFEVELTKLNWRFFNCKILLCCICCCHLSAISLTFWQSLVSHIPKGIGGSPYLEGTSAGKYSFLPFFFFFPFSFKRRREGKTLHCVVLFSLFCQRHRASYNFSTRKEEVYACLVHVYTFNHYANQPRPHTLNCMDVHNHYLKFTWLRNGPQADWTPLDQTNKTIPALKNVTMLHRSDWWHGLSQGLWYQSVCECVEPCRLLMSE